MTRLNIIFLLIIIVGLISSVYLVQQRTQIRSQAYQPFTNLHFLDKPYEGDFGVSQEFGADKKFYQPQGYSKGHPGIDFDLHKGDKVLAADSGIVIFSGINKKFPGRGQNIVIDHDNSFESHYMHLSYRLLEVGDKIESGQAIGEVGSSGLSYGAHLHFGLRDQSYSEEDTANNRGFVDPTVYSSWLNSPTSCIETVRHYSQCGNTPGLEEFPSNHTVLVAEYRDCKGNLRYPKEELKDLDDLGECPAK